MDKLSVLLQAHTDFPVLRRKRGGRDSEQGRARNSGKKDIQFSI